MQDTAWARLRISNRGPGLSPLFLRSSFNPRSYSIFITDLSRVWSEELDDYAITGRGNSEDNHFGYIDKSNFSDLLETVASALKQSDDNKHKIVPGDVDELILHATIALPEPLDPFNWKFHLKLLPLEDISRQLTLPLLTYSFSQSSQIKDLVHIIQEKDKVISKLLDQLDSINVDLATIFPSITGMRGSKKTIKREQAAKHVPGLRIFNEDDWRSISNPRKTNLSSIDEVMENMPINVEPGFLGDDSYQHKDKDWWTHLAEASEPEHVPRSAEVASVENDAMETEDEDEFQRQDTSPQIKRAKPHDEELAFAQQLRNHPQKPEQKNSPEDDETTEDEDLDAPRKPIKQEPSSQRQIENAALQNDSSQVSASKQAPPKSRSKFTIGKPRKAPTPEVSLEERNKDTIASVHKQPVLETVTSLNTSPPAPKRHRFKIGGKIDDEARSGSATLSHTPNTHAVVDREVTHAPGIASRAKISVPENLTPSRLTRPESNVEAAPPEPKVPTPERETADEIAERRRRELKRQLEAKAPAKKKRRL